MRINKIIVLLKIRKDEFVDKMGIYHPLLADKLELSPLCGYVLFTENTLKINTSCSLYVAVSKFIISGIRVQCNL